ncbi:MAG: galactokinase [Verrucomicrobia bacterium]|nr:galactokinase [Verrucomicrobiota bacterium]
MEREIEQARQLFEKEFGGQPVAAAKAPGRAELLGNHTDYNQGLVMALAVDKFIVMAGRPRSDGRVVLVSPIFERRALFEADRIAKDPEAPWADYTKGLLLQLQERGARFGGFEAVIHSTIPLGAGLSSSAALLVASALLLRKLYPYRIPELDRVESLDKGDAPPMDDAERLRLARICQKAENEFVGVNCGLLDHISSLFGRQDQVILIDCLDMKIDWTPMDSETAVVLAHSGVRHELVGGEYNDRRARCERAAKALGVPSLRHVTLEELEQARDRLEEFDYRCALHVVGEIERVARGADLLRRGDRQAFGELLCQSHESSRHNFRNSCPELDCLVELAKEHPACLGARLTGGGFGGATINLARAEEAEDFRRSLASGYAARMGKRLESWICRVVEGAA